MPNKNSIFICVDHAGYSGMKLLQLQLSKIGIVTDMILFAWFKHSKYLALSTLSSLEFTELQTICTENETIQHLTLNNYRSALFSLEEIREIQALLQAQNVVFHLVTTEGFFQIQIPETGSEAQKSLSRFYQNFCDENQLVNHLMSIQMFFNLMSQLKCSEMFEWDPKGSYLLGDLNLGSPDLPHMTPLYDQIVRLCVEQQPGIVLNLFPYSQNPHGCVEANEYIEGKITSAYEDDEGQVCGGFSLTTPIYGLSADKKTIPKLVQDNLDIYLRKREKDSLPHAVTLASEVAPSVPIENTSAAKEPLIKKSADSMALHGGFCGCFFSNRVAVLEEVPKNLSDEMSVKSSR